MADKNRNDNVPGSAEVEHAELDRDIEATRHNAAADQDAVEPAPDRTETAFPKSLDKVTAFLKQADHEVVVTHGDSRRVAKLIDWRILPILLYATQVPLKKT
jgi:hypothetical protein